MNAREVVAGVRDPELPALTIEDLGMIEDVVEEAGGRVTVTLIPTYSGCPATDAIRADVERALRASGRQDVAVRFVLRPAWTTDRLGPRARARLAGVGIAPPPPAGPEPPPPAPACPRCGSPRTRELSRFGATGCRALWACRACQEPFEQFKALR